MGVGTLQSKRLDGKNWEITKYTRSKAVNPLQYNFPLKHVSFEKYVYLLEYVYTQRAVTDEGEIQD